jgi:hypothetical protein
MADKTVSYVVCVHVREEQPPVGRQLPTTSTCMAQINTHEVGLEPKECVTLENNTYIAQINTSMDLIGHCCRSCSKSIFFPQWKDRVCTNFNFKVYTILVSQIALREQFSSTICKLDKTSPTICKSGILWSNLIKFNKKDLFRLGCTLLRKNPRRSPVLEKPICWKSDGNPFLLSVRRTRSCRIDNSRKEGKLDFPSVFGSAENVHRVSSCSISPAMGCRKRREDPLHYSNTHLSFLFARSHRVGAGSVGELLHARVHHI